MNPYWQRIFLTVGILIAVFGMRLLFPLIVVTIAGHVSPVQALELALHHPHQYAAKLTEAHPAIGAFGGIFLLMIFLDFIFEDQDVKWLVPDRAPARQDRQARPGFCHHRAALPDRRRDHVRPARHRQGLVSGAAGLATYLAVSSLSALFESEEEAVVGKADAAEEAAADGGGSAPVKAPPNLARLGLFTFLYLEVLDASFSFDGVVGAFAITDMIFVIALGLGIGACYIRALTVYLVRKGTLAEYVYLEHGAHWAIGALAVLLFVTIRVHVPDIVTGLIGVGFIGAALVSSIVRNRRGVQEIEPTVLPQPLGT